MASNGNRDTKQTNPVKEYIKETDSVSRPTAIFFTLIIFFVGAAVAFSLFWGGRWAYNRIAGNKGEKPNPITETSSISTQNINKSSQKATANKNVAGSGGERNGLSVERSQASTDVEINQTPNTGPVEVPNTGPTEVPNTGPMPE